MITEDGGDSWHLRRAPSHSELIHVDFDGDRRGWIVGAGGTILSTRRRSDLEQTDFRNNGNPLPHRIPAMIRTDGLSVKRAQSSERQMGGETWTKVAATVNSTLLSVQFVNDDDGWAIGRGGTILRSDNGGSSWIQQESGTKQNLYALYFNKKIGWAVGGSGMILRYEK